MKFLYGDDENVKNWVVERIPHVRDFEKYSAIGIMTDDGKPLAGFVYHEYFPEFGLMQISAAADSAKWATRSSIKHILSYPFVQLKVRKLWTATPLKNERALKLNRGIGFKQEAVLAHHFGEDHCVICRMFRKQYETLYKEVK